MHRKYRFVVKRFAFYVFHFPRHVFFVCFDFLGVEDRRLDYDSSCGDLLPGRGFSWTLLHRVEARRWKVVNETLSACRNCCRVNSGCRGYFEQKRFFCYTKVAWGCGHFHLPVQGCGGIKGARQVHFCTGARMTPLRVGELASGAVRAVDGGGMEGCRRKHDSTCVAGQRAGRMGKGACVTHKPSTFVREVYMLLPRGQWMSALEKLECWFAEAFGDRARSAMGIPSVSGCAGWYARDAVLLMMRLHGRTGDMRSVRRVLLATIAVSRAGNRRTAGGSWKASACESGSGCSTGNAAPLLPRNAKPSGEDGAVATCVNSKGVTHWTGAWDGVDDEDLSWCEGIELFHGYLEVISIRKNFDPQEVCWVLSMMKERGAAPNLLTFHYLTEIHIRAGYDPTGLWWSYLHDPLPAAYFAPSPPLACETASPNFSCGGSPTNSSGLACGTELWYFALSGGVGSAPGHSFFSCLGSSYASSLPSCGGGCLPGVASLSPHAGGHGQFLALPPRIVPLPATLQALLVRVVPFVGFLGRHGRGKHLETAGPPVAGSCWVQASMVVEVAKGAVLGSAGGCDAGGVARENETALLFGQHRRTVERNRAVCSAALPASSFVDNKQLVELIEQWLLGSSTPLSPSEDDTIRGVLGSRAVAGSGSAPLLTTSTSAIGYPPEYVMWLLLELEHRCLVDEHKGSFAQHIQRRHLVAVLLHCAKCGDAVTFREVLSLMDRQLVRKTADTGALGVWCFSLALWIEPALEMILWMETKGYLEHAPCTPFFQRCTTVDTLRYTFDRHFLMTFVDALSTPELVERAMRFLRRVRDGALDTWSPTSRPPLGVVWGTHDDGVADGRRGHHSPRRSGREDKEVMNWCGCGGVGREDATEPSECRVRKNPVGAPGLDGSVRVCSPVLDLIVLAWCKIGREREAIRLVESYETEWGVVPRTNTLNALLMGLQWSWTRSGTECSFPAVAGGSGGERRADGSGLGVRYSHDVFVALTQDRADPVVPNAVMYKLLIRQAVQCDEMDEAVGYLREAASGNREGRGGGSTGSVRVEVEMILPILERAARAGDAETATQLSQFALDCDIGIDPGVLHTVMGHLRQTGQAVDVLQGHLRLHEALRLRSKVARQRARASIQLSL